MVKEVIITYETIYEIFRKEKYQTELQKLDPDFFNEVVKYLNEKKGILQSQQNKDSIFSSFEIKKTAKQIESIQKILKELYERRESKIIQLALICSRTCPDASHLPFLLPEEKEFYEKIISDLNFFRNKILNNLLNSNKLEETDKPKDIKDEALKMKLIKTLYPLPKFVGIDLKTYGPFEEEEIVALPDKIADLIISKKRAEEIKT